MKSVEGNAHRAGIEDAPFAYLTIHGQMRMATNDEIGFYIGKNFLDHFIGQCPIDRIPGALGRAMTNQKRRCVSVMQFQHIRPGSKDCLQLLIKLPVQPGRWCKLDGIIPFGGCARRFLIDEEEFVVASNHRPALLDHQFGGLP